MPLFDTTSSLDGTAYGYSGTRFGDLGASEYTLVAITADQSGSVSAFDREIETCLKSIVSACRTSPRADHLMLRLSTFDSRVHEVHGYRPLSACPVDDYDGCIRPSGLTALYDAAHNAVSSLVDYGTKLTERGLSVNGIVFVVTDGGDNRSSLTPSRLAAAVRDATTAEALEGVLTILVGVNVSDPQLGRSLMKLSTEAGFDHYLELQSADASTLARLASFASRSIALTSTALGSGSAVRSLSF